MGSGVFSRRVLTVSEANAMESVPNVKLFSLYFIRYIIYLILSVKSFYIDLAYYLCLSII